MGVRCAAVAFLTLSLATGQDAFHSPIDRVLERTWKEKKIAPADLSPDLEFLRRAYLDIIGVIPTTEEVKAFLRDERPDKRERKIDALTRGNAFASYWSEKLTNDWLGYGNAYFDGNRPAFKKWLREKFQEGKTYPDIVADIIRADIGAPPGAFVRRWIFADFTKPSPETVASRMTRSFLAVQLNCAQCHDHPFDKWTREDFYGMAAFFAGVSVTDYTQYNEKHVKAFKFEGFKEPIAIRFLDGTRPEGKWPRGELAAWIARPDNPWLARAICNRVWAYMFGKGIVDPWDDLNAQTKPSVPGLLDVLVDEFKRTGGDLRQLVKFIANSRAYQRTSEGSGDLFSHAAVRPMLPEQLLNSLMRATGVIPRGSDYNEFKGDFAKLFFGDGQYERLQGNDLTSYRGTIQQVLKMLDLDNNVYDGGRVNGQGLLDKLLAKHEKSPETMFDEIYLACLGRVPTEREREICMKQYKKWDENWNAYEDVFWALLNSNEFFFNH
jgi:hypothetical protein